LIIFMICFGVFLAFSMMDTLSIRVAFIIMIGFVLWYMILKYVVRIRPEYHSICLSCGKNIPRKESIYCPQCGHKIQKEKQAS
ncbi:MAG: hypothetical protein JSV20_06555, partial [Candidatus Bathyarchaeota archaeon]